MKRRHLQLCALLLLPLLALRAFLPSGFMLAPGSDGLELVFCEPGRLQRRGPVSAEAAHSLHAAHGQDAALGGQAGHSAQHAHDHAGQTPMHHGAGSDHDNGLHADLPCPFALVAAALPQGVPYVALAPPSASQPIEFPPRPVVASGPLRAERIRAPPHFS